MTRVGRVLRASSIDELPQLWNVVCGELSLVGPRPSLLEETARFDPAFLARLEMRPGITGLWQVEARHNPSFEANRHLDLFYVENWQLALDLAILLATVHTVVSDTWGALGRARSRRRDGAFDEGADAGSVTADQPSLALVEGPAEVVGGGSVGAGVRSR